jgi:hypothetical protein
MLANEKERDDRHGIDGERDAGLCNPEFVTTMVHVE